MIKNRNMVFATANNNSPDDHRYIMFPNIANASLPTASTANEGGVAYDTDNSALYFSDGSSWAAV